MSKFTPGPWSTYVEKWPNKIVIRSMFTDGTERAQVAVTSAENARLIAAAPELLAVALHSATALRLSGVEANAHSDNPIEWLLHQTEAAIAKATGAGHE